MSQFAAQSAFLPSARRKILGFLVDGFWLLQTCTSRTVVSPPLPRCKQWSCKQKVLIPFLGCSLIPRESLLRSCSLVPPLLEPLTFATRKPGFQGLGDSAATVRVELGT